MALTMLEKLQILLDEDEIPKETYKSALTDEELAARAPDGTRLPEVSFSTLQDTELAHGPSHLPISNPEVVYEDSSPEDSEADAELRAQRLVMASSADTAKRAAKLKKSVRPPVRSSTNSSTNGVRLPSRPHHYVPDIALGKPAQSQQSFCPIEAVSKYPYKFVPKHLTEKIAEKFFVDSKFWYREWEVYYIWPEGLKTPKPILLTPVELLEKLLIDINENVEDCALTVGSEAEEFGLVLSFPDHSELLPRYLGRSHTREEFVKLEKHVPSIAWRPDGEVRKDPPPDERTKEACRLQLEMAYEVSRGRNKANKAAKKQERSVKQQQWKDSLKKAERYLGLRPSYLRLPEPKANASWPEIQAYHAVCAEGKHASKFAPPINPTLPSPYPFDRFQVFIALDVECYEHDKSKVTEIGIATLDTQDLQSVAPGPCGANWQPKIRARHFLIREHLHLQNNDFVAGCPDRFEYGSSELINIADAPARIAECFRPPYGCPSSELSTLGGSSGEKRSVVLVGHDVSQDIRYLSRVGYNVNNMHPGSFSILDTSALHRALVREWQPHSLAGILLDFDLQAWHLHNAGNDAVYTLWVMFAVCVKSASERGSVDAKRKVEERRKEAVVEAVARASAQAMDESLGWSDEGEDVGEDGGVKLDAAA